MYDSGIILDNEESRPKGRLFFVSGLYLTYV